MKKSFMFLVVVMRNLFFSYFVAVFFGCYLFVVMDAYQNEIPDDPNFWISAESPAFTAVLSAIYFMVPVFILGIPSLMTGYIASLFLLSKNIGNWLLWITLPGLIAAANIYLFLPQSESRFLYIVFVIAGALCGFLMRRFSRGLLR